jgi:mRNA-degrading endonuclease HigB of HigAB toxin-antitoxin module
MKNKNFSMDDYKSRYNEITSMCDSAEELLSIVESSSAQNPQAHLDLIEPLINEIADSSDVLAEEFLLIAENNEKRSSNKFSKKRIEAALRRIFVTLNEYQESAKLASKKIGNDAVKLTNAVVKKIKDQLDKVVAIFFEFAQISLQNIMNKAEIDALKARDSRIALMMHQYSISQ